MAARLLFMDVRHSSRRLDWESGAALVNAGYFGAQAFLGVVLWVALARSGLVRAWLELDPDVPAVTDAFVFADLGVIVVGSALSAWAIGTGRRWAVPASAFTAGAVVYPTTYLVIWVALTGVGSIGLALMVMVSTLTCWCAFQVWRASTAT